MYLSCQGKCNDVVTNVFISMMTKLLPPPKTPKGPIHPLPKEKSKDSTAAPCLIQKFACIVRKQPKATSCSDESSLSMKRLRFRKVPHGDRGEGSRSSKSPSNTVQESSLRCTRQLKMFQFHLRLNNMRLSPCKTASRNCETSWFRCCTKLWVCCWNEDTCDITCKECRFVSGPKALKDIGRFPSIATAAPKAGVSWLVDSGSESDLCVQGYAEGC